MSRPYLASKGLEGRHIALWQSHGKYYKNNKGSWEWQRPRLFCTTEDLFTQSFVVPYIIPMLENAGAVVYTPRERDRQRNESYSGQQHSYGKKHLSRREKPERKMENISFARIRPKTFCLYRRTESFPGRHGTLRRNGKKA